jgi:hypothetical protein
MRTPPKRQEDRGIEIMHLVPALHRTLSAVTVHRFSALQRELVALVEQDHAGLTPQARENYPGL